LFVLTAAVAGFMALDRTLLHWYVPDLSSVDARLLEGRQDVAGLDKRIDQLRADMEGIRDDVQGLQKSPEVSDALAVVALPALGRLATAVTINSLVQNYGGYQRSDSPAGQACRNWLILGQGSITDCGFTR